MTDDREKVAQAVADAIDLVLDELMDVPTELWADHVVADQPIVRSATDRILAQLGQGPHEPVVVTAPDGTQHAICPQCGGDAEQEPVAWAWYTDEDERWRFNAEGRKPEQHEHPVDKHLVPLYARPQPTESCVCGHDRAQHQGAAPEAGTTSCDVCECSLLTRPQPTEGAGPSDAEREEREQRWPTQQEFLEAHADADAERKELAAWLEGYAFDHVPWAADAKKMDRAAAILRGEP